MPGRWQSEHSETPCTSVYGFQQLPWGATGHFLIKLSTFKAINSKTSKVIGDSSKWHMGPCSGVGTGRWLLVFLNADPEGTSAWKGSRARSPATVGRELGGLSTALPHPCRCGAGIPSTGPLGTHPEDSGPCYCLMQIFQMLIKCDSSILVKPGEPFLVAK